MRDVANSLDFKLFLEGVPVPMISATVSGTIGRPAAANISIPPTIKSQNITERTAVHIFYRDFDEIYADDVVSSQARQPVYKLLFGGEVVSLSYTKERDSRATVLMCEDVANNFEHAHKYALENNADMAGAANSTLITGSDQDPLVLDYTGSNIILSPIASLVGGEENIVMGVQKLITNTFRLIEDDGSTTGTNEFLSSVEERFKISHRLGFIEDEEIKKLVEQKKIINLMQRTISRMTGVVPLSAIINMFLNFVYYNRVSILTPSYTFLKFPSEGRSEAVNSIKNIMLLPNIYFSAPPKCNVLFPSHIRNLGYSEDFLKSPTRMLMQAGPYGLDTDDPVKIRASTFGAPRELNELVETDAFTGNKVLGGKLTSEEKTKGVIPVSKSLGKPEYSVQLSERRDATDSETQGTSGEQARNYILNMAEYELELRRASTRNVHTMSGPFNPEVVIGFPMVAIDEIMFIFGMLASVSHHIHASSGAQTTYSLQLPRKVINDFTPPVFDDISLERQAHTLVSLYVADLDEPNSDKRDDDLLGISEATRSILSTFVAADVDRRIIDIMRRIPGAQPPERDSLLPQYIALITKGVYENLPETPRWVNSAFNHTNSGINYTQLIGCGGLMDPIETSDGPLSFATMAEAARDLLNRHRSVQDPFAFSNEYGHRSNVTKQLDFDEFYELETPTSDDQPYKPTGPFTRRRQNVILDYVKDLNNSRGHLG